MNRRFSTEHVQWPSKTSESLDTDGNPERKESIAPKPKSSFRVAASQVLATTAKNLLLLDMAMAIAFATIVNPALLGNKDSKGLSLTKEEVSWFGSLLFIFQPLGSIFSGALLEPIGRKKAMMLVNFPHILGWFFYYFTETKTMLFLSAISMGLGIGFMEAPVLTYVGEITEPRLRGILASYAYLFVTFGFMFIYTLGNLVDWRTAAAIAAVVPIGTILAISQVPESPIWLLSRGRTEEAEKALCWLRGWVGPEYVKKEFQELLRYSESTKLMKNKNRNGIENPAFVSDDFTQTQDDKHPEELTFADKVTDLLRPGMMKPLALISLLFFFGHFTGTTASRPYMVILAEEFHMPIDPYKATAIFGAAGFLGSVMCMVTIAKFKKRPIALTSYALASLSGFGIFFISHPWAAFIFYMTQTFFTFYGAVNIVWTYLSEVFPFRGRGVVSGLSAAISYLVSFLATKTFQSLKDWLTPRGVFAFYGSTSLVGLLFIYFFLPETEGRSLEEIEREYEKPLSYQKRGQAV